MVMINTQPFSFKKNPKNCKAVFGPNFALRNSGNAGEKEGNSPVGEFD